MPRGNTTTLRTPSGARCEIRFVDSAGRHWHRNINGALALMGRDEPMKLDETPSRVRRIPSGSRHRQRTATPPPPSTCAATAHAASRTRSLRPDRRAVPSEYGRNCHTLRALRRSCVNGDEGWAKLGGLPPGRTPTRVCDDIFAFRTGPPKGWSAVGRAGQRTCLVDKVCAPR